MPITTLSNPKIQLQLSGDLASDIYSGAVNHRPTPITLGIGTSSAQVNRIAAFDFTVDSGTPYDIDLTATTDPAGGTVALDVLNQFLVENRSAVDFTIGGGTNPVFGSNGATLKPGGRMLVDNPNAGLTVDGTHKIFRVAAASGTGNAGRISLMGRDT